MMWRWPTALRYDLTVPYEIPPIARKATKRLRTVSEAGSGSNENCVQTARKRFWPASYALMVALATP